MNVAIMTDSGLLMGIWTRGPIKWPEALAEGFLIGQRVQIPLTSQNQSLLLFNTKGRHLKLK